MAKQFLQMSNPEFESQIHNFVLLQKQSDLTDQKKRSNGMLKTKYFIICLLTRLMPTQFFMRLDLYIEIIWKNDFTL